MLNELCYQIDIAKNKFGQTSVLPIKKLMNLKRNDPCFCGSGQKYKKCCYQILEMTQPLVEKEEQEEVP